MSAQEVAERTADRLESTGVTDLNAVLAYDRALLIEQARQIDARDAAGPLTGLSVAVKDNICTVDLPTTCASRILEGYHAPYEATAVARLKAAGALIACKTNLDEFAMGSSTEHSAFGPCKHPTHPDRVPGGSSGGSAALVAAGAVDAALGSETGGSVRQPAAFCGVVGFKPSYGCVSRFGLVAFGSSLDQIGVFGRTVDHVSRVLAVISGADINDSTCHDRPAVPRRHERSDLRGLTVGVPRECLPADLDPHTLASCHRTIDWLRDAGVTIRDVSLPHAHLAVPAYYVIAPAEASSNLARYDGVRYGLRAQDFEGGIDRLYRASRRAGFGPEVTRRIIVGTYVLSAGYYDAYYRNAQIARGHIADDYGRVFESGVDLLFSPTTPGPAFKVGERLADPVSMYLADQFVCAANLVGLPAISLPVGVTPDGLPLGVQLIGRRLEDDRLLDAAAVVQTEVDPTQVVS